VFYVAHRLFAAHDRALGALAAERLAAKAGAGNVFLPFCDTDEENLVAQVKGQRLFELDTHRLRALSGMLAILHGPSLDDGVCMEIGYAAALGAPIVVVTTDFTTYGLAEEGPELAFPDPLIQTVCNDVVRMPRLAPVLAHEDRFVSFSRRNTCQLEKTINHAVNRLLDVARPLGAPSRSRHQHHAGFVFCEPSPYWADSTWALVLDRLRERGYHPSTATRLSTSHAAGPVRAAITDWATATAAAMLVADVSGPETPPGAAVLIGAFTALGRPVLARHPRPVWTFAGGREPNRRNLMVQYAVRHWFTDLPDLPPLARS
jgi:nucleoside 2-deoxyribosyltransferase